MLTFTGTAGADPAWTVAYPEPPNAAGQDQAYRGIAALSPADAWATGFDGQSALLLQHWDGTRWTGFAPPAGDPCAAAGESCIGGAIDASSKSNVVTVVQDATSGAGMLVWRWDGTHWTELPTPPGSFFTSPSVKVFSATDVWLAGTSSDPSGELTTVAMHWDGVRWIRFDTPDPDVHRNVFQTIAGTAPDDVWAGGYWTTGTGRHSVQHSLLAHFDGHAWTQVAAPDSATGSSPVGAVVALSRTNAWAGTAGTMLHWNGTAWTAAATGIPAQSMTALSANDICAAPGVGGVVHHFDGSAWSAVTLPLVAPSAAARLTPFAPPVPAHYELAAAASAGPGTVWFVGAYVPVSSPAAPRRAVIVSTG
jgi:hypothetical protein